jgi:uncharacterized protein
VNRLVVWRGLDTWRAEVASIELLPRGARATGTQIGVEPVPYRLDYRLEAAGRDFVTESLEVQVTGEAWGRRLRLSHDGEGGWRCEAASEGFVDLPPAGGDVEVVEGALDCDLGLSPMTNLMPVRRHNLHREPGEVDFLMAWVSVPALSVHPSKQRYEHVRKDDRGSVVRYVGEHRDYVGELELDQDGLVVVYPELACRVLPEA